MKLSSDNNGLSELKQFLLENTLLINPSYDLTNLKEIINKNETNNNYTTLILTTLFSYYDDLKRSKMILFENSQSSKSA